MKRPYIVCHMMTALDGKITGPYMNTAAIKGPAQEYERTNASYRPQAWLCGRVTTDDFLLGERIQPGRALFTLVEEDTVWVVAQLAPAANTGTKVKHRAPTHPRPLVRGPRSRISRW